MYYVDIFIISTPSEETYLSRSDHSEQAGKAIPSYFSGNANRHWKDKKSSETKIMQLGEETFATPVRQ